MAKYSGYLGYPGIVQGWQRTSHIMGQLWNVHGIHKHVSRHHHWSVMSTSPRDLSKSPTPLIRNGLQGIQIFCRTRPSSRLKDVWYQCIFQPTLSQSRRLQRLIKFCMIGCWFLSKVVFFHQQEIQRNLQRTSLIIDIKDITHVHRVLFLLTCCAQQLKEHLTQCSPSLSE